MSIMNTTRSYWVDWICTFDNQPKAWDIKKIHAQMKKYIIDYLNDLPKISLKNTKNKSAPLDEKWEEWNTAELKWLPCEKKKKKTGGDSNYWIQTLKIEWDQISFKPLIYNCKAYFEDKNKRYTGEQKGSMTPPKPPDPPGSLSSTSSPRKKL